MNNEIIYSSWFVDGEPFIDELKKGKYKFINEHGIKKILDYITNLEQEKEKLNQDLSYYQGYGADMLHKNNVLEERIEKAIPMLKELNIKLKDILNIGINIKEISDIENVLNGRSDE